MAFIMNRSPNDEKLFHKETENIVTLGRGSYTDTFDMSVGFGKMNVLGGRFCSLAKDIYFSMGGNHSMNSVTTSPLDRDNVVKRIFGKIRPDLHQIPDVRIQHLQIIFGHDVWIGQSVTIMGGVKLSAQKQLSRKTFRPMQSRSATLRGSSSTVSTRRRLESCSRSSGGIGV